MASSTQFDIFGKAQINPSATQAVQNIFITAGTAANQMVHTCQPEVNTVNAQIYDMYYLSSTSPCPIENEIIRKQELKLCENRLEKDNILFLTGEEDIGLTTLLAQFARIHGNNCVSYFNTGLDLALLNPDYVEQDIATQLNRYVLDSYDYVKDMECTSISSLNHRVMQKMKKEKAPLYFVFDGFDNIPEALVDGIRKIFEKLIWKKCRFIFTGDSDKIKQLIPDNKDLQCSEHQILPFSDSDVNEYFRQLSPELSESDLEKLRCISRCQAGRMSIINKNYIAKGRLEELLNSNKDQFDDLYEDDYNHIFASYDDDVPVRFMTLLAYAEFPITIPLAAEILQVDKAILSQFCERYNDIICLNEKCCLKISTEGFHKYLRKKLSEYKKDVELDIIRILELPSYINNYGSFIPAIYKDLNLNDKLVNYLSNENILSMVVGKCTQAVLNEQCEYGFEACDSDPEKYAGGLIRFALNKSASREIEENRLLDNEIDALLAVGRYNQAIDLAQSVYLVEERLKCLCLIARKKKQLQRSDYEVIKETIDMLVSNIQFEKMPNKAIELAKLLLPIDFKSAISIVDRIEKTNKESINTDKVYTIMSLMREPIDSESSDANNPDLIDDRIKNTSLRSFANAAKSLFAEETADEFLHNLSTLPSNSHKLYLLQIWLPEHQEKEDIGKVVLEGIKLIVAESDTSMPRASMLDTFCKSMSKMTLEEMDQALTIIESLSDTIKYPTLDYIDAELTIIESISKLKPDQAIKRLEYIYTYILDLKDDSIRMSCLSKLLGRYDYLGDRRRIEKEIVSTVDLRKEVSNGVKQLLDITACHIKIVEEPIKALVCDYPTMIDEFVKQVNTAERRSRAYSLAALYYVYQSEPEKFDASRLFSLVRKASFRNNDGVKPLMIFTERILHDKRLKPDSLLPHVKSNISIFSEVESITDRCRLYLGLYRWISKHYPEDTFSTRLRNDIVNSWKSINHPTFKIQFGYFIAKEFARVSQSSAEDMLDKCDQLKKNAISTSSSSLSACNEAIDLYTRSLRYLIRFDMCKDEDISQFYDDVDKLLAEEDKIMIWGQIAMEYYLVSRNDRKKGYESKFRDVCNRYLPCDYSHLPIRSQKCVIFNNAGVLFVYSSDTFFSILSRYDETFRNDCIEKATQFVITKYASMENVAIDSSRGFDMDYNDYLNIISLMARSTSDEYMYRTCEMLSQSIRKGHTKYPLSTNQKLYITAEAKKIISNTLPTSSGIRHDGYKIICLAMLDYAVSEFGTKDKQRWHQLISTVENTADRAFLYFAIGPFFQRSNDKQELFNEGLKLTDSISSYYDKVNRLDMSITECYENSMTDMIKDIANKAMECLSGNGSVEDHLRLVDAVYQYNSSLAEKMLDNLDNDPARMHYKQKLLEHISSKKKIEKVHKEQNSLEDLNRAEQLEFFREQVSDLACNKAQLLDLPRLLKLTIKHIYDNNLSNSKNAILFLLENLYRKMGKTRQHKELLYGIHLTIRHNLKIVLSLAVKTKEGLQRIDETIYTRGSESDGFIGVGDYGKGEKYIMEWAEKKMNESLVIIDPYFSPDDLRIIKNICDMNNDVKIDILCHCRKVKADDFLSRWRQLSNIVTNRINIFFVYYKDKPDDGPLHDRYWICCDEENGNHSAIKPPSVNSLGMKESSICEIDLINATSALDSFNRYAYRRPKRKEGRDLSYDHIELS